MNYLIRTFLISIVLIAFAACSSSSNNASTTKKKASTHKKPSKSELDTMSKAYFASGCFWCVESVFESVKGVSEAVSGYSGGKEKNPTYEDVSAGRTSHAEAIEVYYDPAVVSYETLLNVFFGSHDPTTLNQQGPDRGTQYRSAIYYQNEKEKTLAENYIKELTAAGTFEGKITTEVALFDIFYIAEEYHQDYEHHNPLNPYIQQVSIPRLSRFKRKFPELLK